MLPYGLGSNLKNSSKTKAPLRGELPRQRVRGGYFSQRCVDAITPHKSHPSVTYR